MRFGALIALGLVFAAGLGLAGHLIARDTVALPVASIEAGEGLAPAQTQTDDRATTAATTRRTGTATTRTGTTTTRTTTTRRATTTETGEDSGRGRGRGRGRGGDDSSGSGSSGSGSSGSGSSGSGSSGSGSGDSDD
jgi:hypothetical protein